MALPAFNMQDLFDAGVHFGHRAHRWNPKMREYLFTRRDGIHIIDLTQTVPLLRNALHVIRDTVAAGGRVLFVGTKRQAAEEVAEAAKRSSQYYVSHRWLGGMLTNWETITEAIKRLEVVEEELADKESGLTKKELLQRMHQRDKLERAIGGVRQMGGLPDLIVIIDTNREMLAVEEAWRLNIPVVAIVDSDSDPDKITYPIPGNDDAGRAVGLYCDFFARAALEGIARAEISDTAPEDKGAEDEAEPAPESGEESKDDEGASSA